MMRKHLAAGIWPLCLFIFSLNPFFVNAQEGDFYVSNYIIEPDRIDNPFFTITQSANGLIQVANRSGLLQFDGHRWERIPCPGAVYAIEIVDGRYYVGGKFGYGYIEVTPEGKSFVSLSEEKAIINIFDIAAKGDYIYFLSSKSLYVYSTETSSSIKQYEADSTGYVEIVEYNDIHYLIHDDGTTSKIEGQDLTSIPSPFPNNSIPLFFEKTESGKAIMGTLDNKIYLSYSNQFYEVPLEDEGYIASNSITTGLWVNDSLAAIGTLKGGVAFIDPATGKLKQIINSHTGLSDNEVLGMETDRDHGLWVAQSNGLDRVAPFLPVSNFTNYPGLSGKLVSLYPHEGSLYVSTTLGVYTLKEVKDFKEIISYIRTEVEVEEPEPKPRPRRERAIERREQKSQEETEEEKPKRRLFSFLRKNKAEQQEEPKTDRGLIGRIFKSEPEIPRDSVIIEKRINRELQSIRYVYQRINGIDSKCSIYEIAGDDFIIAGLAGIYTVDGEESTQISSESVRDIHYSHDGFLVAAMLSGSVKYFQKNGDTWEEVDELADLEDKPYHIFEDSQSNLLLTGTDLVYRLVRSDSTVTVETFGLQNPFSDRTITIEEDGRVLFINPTGFYTFTEGDSSIWSFASLKDFFGTPRKYFTQGPYAWVYNGARWFKMGEVAATESPEVIELRLLKDLKYVTYDEQNGYYWAITADDQIYKITPIKSEIKSNYDLFLKDFNNNDQLDAASFKLTENDGSLVFEYVHPDYSGVLGIQYRYRLEGLSGGWSNWMENNQFNFPYLPAGNYEIIVQSKDIFGQTNESRPIEFTILPPYWQRPWFYGLEIILFSALFGLSIKLNRSNNRRYLILNRLLAFLTLLLMVEFVQAIAEAKLGIESSPVFNFFIQVVIAAAILPVERLLRKWLIGEPVLATNGKDKSEKSEEKDD